MKKFYAKLLIAMGLLLSSSAFAQVTGLAADDANPCPNQTVNISWALGSGGGGQYFIQVGTTGPGSQDITFGSQPSNNFQVIAQIPGQTYFVTVTGQDNVPSTVSLMTEQALVAPTAFNVDGTSLLKVCANTSFNLAAVGGSMGTKQTAEWSTDNFGTIAFTSNPYTANYTVGAGIAAATTYYVRYNSTCPGATPTAGFSALVDIYIAPTAPTSAALASPPFCPNVSTSFVAVGGSLGDNPDNYAVFSFNGGPFTATSTYTATSGEAITVEAGYYDACAMTVVPAGVANNFSANTASVAPTMVNIITADPYCAGTNVTFQAVGATLGTNGFYEVSIDGGMSWSNNGISDMFTVIAAAGPSVTAIFRVVDDCDTTATAMATATAYVNPAAVVSVTANPAGAVCNPTVVTYTANGGSLGNHPNSVYAYSTDGGLTWVNNGSNNFYSTNVVVATTVIFDIQDGCVNPVFQADGSALLMMPQSATTNVAANNTAPTAVTPSAASTCGVQNITFTTDGVRGDNAEYQYRVNGGMWTITPSLPTAGNGTFDLSITADATVDVRIFGGCNDVSATVVSTMIDYQAANVAPTSLLASAPSACGTQNITFTAQGSTRGDGAVYEYSVNGGAWTQTLNAGTDNFIVLSISANTTVDMHILGGCNDVSLTEVSTSVTFATANVAPTSLMASAPTTCGAANITFTADGSLGDGATYEYSTDGGASWTATGNLGADNFIVLNVTQDITVDFRIFGGCNDVSATEVQASVDYQEPSVAPTTLAGVDGTMAPVTSGSSVCPNTTVTVTASGYTVGDGATFEVATDGVTFVATGNAGADDFVTFNVAASTTYNVVFRLVGGCNGTQTSGTFTVTGFPSQPTVTSVTIDKDNICANSGEIVTFTTYTSAVVNAPYTYEWYTFDPITNTYAFLVSDNDGDLQLTPTATTTYAVRIEGCGVTSPYVATLVTVKTISVVPTSISVSPNDSICPGNTIALTANGGFAGSGATLEWFDGTNTVGVGNPFFANPTSNVSYQVRYVGDCNTTLYSTALDIHTFSANDIATSNGTACANTTLDLNTLVNPVGGTFSGTGVTGSSFSSAVAGTFTITYTKSFTGGCQFSKTFDVTVNPLPSGSISGEMPAGCNDNTGSFTVTGSGANGPFTYSSNNGMTYPGSGASFNFTGLASGTYSVRVMDALGCVSNAISATVGNTSGLAVSTVHADVNCFGNATGEIEASSIGGLAPYTYAISNDGGTTWSVEQVSPDFSGLVAGTYQIRVTDSNSPACTDVETVVIDQPVSGLDLTIDTYENVSCFGGNDGIINNVQATGGTAPYEYSITPGGSGFGTSTTFGNLSAGVYTITVRDDNGCEAPFSYSIEEPTQITSNVTTIDYVESNNTYEIKISRAGGTGSLVVSINGGAFTLDSIFTGVAPGTYTYVVKDNNGCEITETFTLIDPSSVGSISKNVDLSVYPNPFNNVINITGVDNNAQVTVINLFGQVVRTQQVIKGNNLQINAANLPAGMYIVKIKANGNEVSRKLIKE